MPTCDVIRVGEMRQAMTYTIAGGNTFNMVLSHPEAEDPETWDQSKALESMKKHFKGWDPRYVVDRYMIRSLIYQRIVVY